MIFNLKTPSDALEAMCDGLEKADARPDFSVAMMDYGSYREATEHAYGCAATCAAMEAADLQLDITNIAPRSRRAAAFDVDVDALEEFEEACSRARHGTLGGLFRLFGLDYSDAPYDYRWEMCTDSWREQLPRVREAIKEMRLNGH